METILIADDEKNLRYSLKRMFEEKKYNIIEAKNGNEIIDIVKKEQIDLLIMDIRMPGISGIEALKEIKKIYPNFMVIIMTAFGTTETAIEAMKFGAYDYVTKPFDIPKMWSLVESALKINKQIKNKVVFEKNLNENTEHIIGNSLQMQEVYKIIGQVAGNDITVLLRGESGTGKELVARAIYQHSKRDNKPYLAINCAAIPETLLESELFGHEKGAFTDARTQRVGKFEQCNGGTLFLDEIGDMPLATQAKILRVLQEKEIIRIGGNESIKIDVRLIVATNINLEKAISEGKFRQDLYYRLNVVSIKLPTLNERKQDIPFLVDYFLSKFNKELNKNILSVDKSALEKLLSYNWPGNVRELENTIKRACVLCKSNNISINELSLDILNIDNQIVKTENNSEQDIEKIIDNLYHRTSIVAKEQNIDIMSIIEKAIIKKVLNDADGNQLKAAKILAVNRNTLRSKIEKYNIKITKGVED